MIRTLLSSELDRTYRRTDPEVLEWIQERTIDGMDRILANLRLEGPELHVNTNSERRLEDVLASIRELDPDATVVSDEREALPDARAAAKLAGQQPPGGALSGRPEDQPPEVQEALAAYMRDYEQKWLDLSVPALQGLTPRQAAEDPTRREDLVRLLASFGDEPDNPMAMSPSRLRAALGLCPMRAEPQSERVTISVTSASLSGIGFARMLLAFWASATRSGIPVGSRP